MLPVMLSSFNLKTTSSRLDARYAYRRGVVEISKLRARVSQRFSALAADLADLEYFISIKCLDRACKTADQKLFA